MNIEEKTATGYPNQNFRHPQYGLNRCPTESDWADCVWLGEGDKPTLAELGAVPDSPEKVIADALAAIYEPVEYNGKLYPADAASMAKYEMAKQSKGRGKASKGVAIAVDGSVLKLSSPTAIDNFHAAIEDAVVARLNAVHDAL